MREKLRLAKLKIAIVIVLVVTTSALAIPTFISLNQLRQHISRVPVRSQDTPTTYGLAYTENFITSQDNIRLNTWYIPSVPSRATVILIPGIRRSKVDMLGPARQLYAAGYSTLLVDLRGEGGSQGDQSYLGTKEWQDVSAAFDFAKSQPESQGRKVGFVSFSMGSAATLVAAGKLGIGEFILAAVPFTNFNRLADFNLQQRHWPTWLSPFSLLAGRILLGAGYQETVPERYIRNIRSPILLVGGDRDQTVLPTDAAYLYSLANQPKQLWQSPDGHFVFEDNPDAFGQRMLDFLNEYAK